MTRKQALARARRILAEHDIDDAALECELLLQHTLRITRVELYLSLEQELGSEQEGAFWQLIRRRLEGEPTAYISGHREFYGLDFYVDHRALIPRPESELLVEGCLSLARNYPLHTIADIGTGSGAIAISLAVNLPQARIYATDISAEALEVAYLNCQKHGVENRLRLLQGSLLDPLPGRVDLIVANLPYVRESELCGARIFEPLVALNGGASGLEIIRELCRQLDEKLQPRGRLILEIGQGQSAAVASLLRHHFPNAEIEITADYGGIDRVVTVAPHPAIVKAATQALSRP